MWNLKAFQIGIRKVAVAGTLGIMLVVPFAALACLVQERLEWRPAPPSAAAQSAMALKEINSLAPVGRAYEANAVILPHNTFPADSADFLSTLAGALLFLPFGLSTLRFWRTDRAAT
jgi:hypothetical protein